MWKLLEKFQEVLDAGFNEQVKDYRPEIRMAAVKSYEKMFQLLNEYASENITKQDFAKQVSDFQYLSQEMVQVRNYWKLILCSFNYHVLF